MTHNERLEFCKKCANKKFDVKQGILCGLTGEKATFSGTCPDYILDEVAQQEVESSQAEAIKEMVLNEFRWEQNLPRGIISGIVIGVVGAILWGIITVVTQYQIGYMALAIGAGVGMAMRYTGKGVDQIFGIAGAIISLFSCMLGNILSVIGFVAINEGLGYLETLLIFNYAYVPQIMIDFFDPIDLLFYGLAIYGGYHFAFRVITEEDVEKHLGKQDVKEEN